MSASDGGNSVIEDIVARLAAQEEEIGSAIKRLEKDLAERRKQHKSVRAALAELRGGSKNKTGGKGATTREVIGLIDELLRESPGQTGESLKAAVIARGNGPQTGIHLRIKSALKDRRFEQRGDRWFLSACAKESAHGKVRHENEMARTT